WLARLALTIGLDEAYLPQGEIRGPVALQPAPDWAATVTATLHPLPADRPPISDSTLQSESEPVSARGSLVKPVLTRLTTESIAVETDSDERVGPSARVWRVVAAGRDAPAWVVGKLAHEALRRWMFPDAPGFDDRLRPAALEAGLTDEAVIRAALRDARRLLERFRAHPLFAEMDAAQRYHEVPYALGDDVGKIDVLYLRESRWTVADFKTDELRDEAEMRKVAEEEYDRQLRRYADAIAAQLGQRPNALLIFLNVGKAIALRPLPLS
ncbi:MAG: PD-(D/E)XK nuclease family protein, partial [Chloroflexi bacterium]|nr:PD-(D/E)XK nuclease family protein [Chloroflexota bacterium]